LAARESPCRSGALILFAMLVGVRLCRFVGVHPGLPAVGVRDVRVMRRLFVTASFMMLCRLSVLFRSVTAVL
jgi:hypothetical protein